MALAGKVAIVTGAAKGIGLACARALGQAEASVLLADVNEEAAEKAAKQLEAEGLRVASAKVDVGNSSEVQQMVKTCVKHFGHLDILVANAGIVKAANFLEMKEDDFDEVIRVNLKGVFLSGQAAGKQMVKQGRGGVIINMSSVNAVMAIPTIAAYNASKGGVNNLTRCMALSLQPYNIRVNAIGPGSIMTDVLRQVAKDKAAIDKVLSRTPMGRAGDPAEIGSIAVFLASQASSYITGQTIYADGGRMALNYTVPVPPNGSS